MDDETAMIAEAVGRIFADLADPQTVNAARDAAWRAPLWAALEEAGLTRAWLPEEAGGAGLSLAGGFEIMRISGHYAAGVPLAETLLGGWLLHRAGLEVPAGALTVAPMRPHDRLSLVGGALTGQAAAVPYAAEATSIVVAADGQVALVDPGAATLTPRPTDMGGRRADIAFDGAAPLASAVSSGAEEALARIGATARACQMTGALETALKITTDYTQEREAFGRKIAKFQAVQQNLAVLAGEVAAAMTASGSAADTLAAEPLGSSAALLEVAAAKVRCGEAVEQGAMIAHQAHGAIGWTQDYTLQMFTRAMWGWRDDFGPEAHWATRLGRHMAAEGADRIWPILTTR